MVCKQYVDMNGCSQLDSVIAMVAAGHGKPVVCNSYVKTTVEAGHFLANLDDGMRVGSGRLRSTAAGLDSCRCHS